MKFGTSRTLGMRSPRPTIDRILQPETRTEPVAIDQPHREKRWQAQPLRATTDTPEACSKTTWLFAQQAAAQMQTTLMSARVDQYVTAMPSRSPQRKTYEVDTFTEDYVEVLAALKREIRSAQVRAHSRVNQELLGLYSTIGSALAQRRNEQAWGGKALARLAADLRKEFPHMTGFSERSLLYMRTFAETWPRSTLAQQAAAQMPWGHVMVLLDKLDTLELRDWYAGQAAEFGWSRAVLLNQIKSGAHERAGAAPSNFGTALAAEPSELTAQLVKDPYNFAFLGLSGKIAERDLEQRLMNRIQEFLLELGDGFALYKRQHRFTVGRKEFVIDLVFFNVTQNRFVVVELKVEEFEPEHLGQLQFYVEWAERHLKKPHHLPTVGILLVADKEDIVVRYALAASTSPIAVATYTYDKLPAATRKAFPSTDRLRDAARNTP
jgi:predicted nuclease of restriction endonuclease-like (RecB) superfamily